MASQYGWTPDYIERCLTDEQLFGILDAATDRLSDRSRHEFESMVEAVRVGTITAHDRKAFSQWQHALASRRPKGRVLTDDALESAIRGIAAMFPDNVDRVTA